MNRRNVELLGRYVSHPLKAEVEGALSAAERFAERSTAIRGNKDLSELGRTKELQAQIRSALRDIRDAGAPIDALRTKLATLVASIKPVSFAKDDLAGAMLRQELRAALKAMSLGDKAAVLLGEKADPAFVDAALEAPALLSGVDAKMFEQVREQRLETLFSRESFEVEALSEQIAEAEAALQISRDDVARAAALPPHEFAKIAEAVNSRRNAPWLKRDKDINGNDIVIVVPLRGGAAKPATLDDIRDGNFYRDYAEYQADRAA